MSQMLSVKNIFKTDTEQDHPTDESQEVTFGEQQMAIRTLFEIRQSIGLIYKQCNDVGIKRMVSCFRWPNEDPVSITHLIAAVRLLVHEDSTKLI